MFLQSFVPFELLFLPFVPKFIPIVPKFVLIRWLRSLSNINFVSLNYDVFYK